jgi:protocatechuate 3,4-dioxygenase beta subunit
MGPFYRKGIPAGGRRKPVDANGFSLSVEGNVWNAKGDRVEGVIIEVWQADEKGIYDLEGHHYRAKLDLGAKPVYHFDTIMPGHYPDRVDQHIHYSIKASGGRLAAGSSLDEKIALGSV